MPKRWGSEEEFRSSYDNVRDPRQQIEMIRVFREDQRRMVGNLTAMVSALSGKQYIDPSQHFFLELLQNADDNKYAKSVLPTIEFVFKQDTLTIRNNEIGFTYSDVYSITTAALSTKYMNADNTYIGQKGIGFKSVFAVADRVDIHSRGYHFSLYNNEYIIPHWIDEPHAQSTSTEIVLHLSDNHALRAKILESLKKISRQTLGMILFLSKLKCIVIDIEDIFRDTIRLEDQGNYRNVISSHSPMSRYFLYKYSETLSTTEIISRYRDLYQDRAAKEFSRDVIFAVPDPAVVNIADFVGHYFAFLQTRMITGMPMHIQIDAETPSSREQYTLMSDSPWNAKMLSHLEEHLYRLFLVLRDEPGFRQRLPEFFPAPGATAVNANEDAQSLLLRIRQGLPEQPLFLSRSGEFKRADQLVLLSAREPELFYQEAKYEKFIKDLLPSDRNYKPGMAFVDQRWNRNYRKVLAVYRVHQTDAWDHFILLRAGPPSTVRLNDYLSVMQFIQQIYSLFMEVNDHAKPGEITQEYLQSAKIFPVQVPSKNGLRRDWVSASGPKELRWQNVTSKRARGPGKTFLYIDAEFTYQPGGQTKNREAIAKYNNEYRDFLARIGIKQHSLLSSLIDAHLTPLTRAKGISPQAAESHWISIYHDFWLKQSLLERERKEVVQEFLDLFPDCQVPVLLADPAKTYTTRKAKECFVGDTYRADATALFREYLGSEAPIVHFTGFSNKAKIKWDDWRELFISKCGVHTGPYLVIKDLKTDNLINAGVREISTRDEDLASQNPFISTITRAVKRQLKFKEIYGSYSIHYDAEGKHQTLDQYSRNLLLSNPDSDFLARELARTLWSNIDTHVTVSAGWKANNFNYLSVENRYFESYIIPRLGLKDTNGKLIQHGTQTYLYSKANRDILGTLGIYVKDSDYYGNFAFLEAWGVKREVDAGDVLKIHDSCVKKLQRGDASQQEYTSHLGMVCSYMKSMAQDKDVILKSILFWNQDQATTQAPRIWVRSALSGGFPDGLVHDLQGLFAERDDLSVEELLDELFQGKHQLDEALIKVIAALGASVSLDSSRAVVDINARFELDGITLARKTIHNRAELPVIWLLSLGYDQEEAQRVGVWVLPPDTVSESFRKGLQRLEWPTSDDMPKSVESAGERALTSGELHKLKEMYYPSDEGDIQETLPTNATGREIRLRIHSNAIAVCQGLYFGVNGIMLPVQYALHDKLYLHGSIDPLFSLMCRLGGGANPKAMKMLWEAMDTQKEPTAEQAREGRQGGIHQDDESTSSGAKTTKVRGSGYSSGPHGSTFAGNDSADRREGTNTRSKSHSSGPYVFYRSGIYASKPSDIPDPSRRETGKMGEEIVVKAEIDEARAVEVQPENNPGFDLISRDETEERYIEVKTVNGAWSHVLLTRSEFAAAQKYDDRYWVYVVELVGDGKHTITRIQNPFAKVTHYSLDDGWRVVENPHYKAGNDDYDDLYAN